MINDAYKARVSKLISHANEKGLIKTYSQFCDTHASSQMAVNEEETAYYTSANKKEMKKFSIGDIVFVSNYKYKSGNNGQNHIFVIIDDGQAVDINYFGFLLSSQISKSTYRYNEKLCKNNFNNLHKDSIVKFDDLIMISETDIQFKIGEVSLEDLERFIATYEKYLSEN